MKSLVLIVGLLLISSSISGQEAVPDLAAFQKTIKNDLIKNAPAITGVSFEGCKAVFKVTRGGWYTMQKASAAAIAADNPEDPRKVVSQNPPAGAEAAANLSSGAGDDISTLETDKFAIDFSALDRRQIVTRPSRSRGMSRFMLYQLGERPAITRNVNSKVETLPVLSFDLKTDAIERVAGAVQAVIERCFTPKS